MLKSLNVKMVEKRITMASTGLSRGSVTYQNRATRPAPSACAASYSSFGIETSPARMVMTKKGRPRQIFTTITAVMAKYLCPSQLGPGGSMSPRAIPVQFTTLYSELNIHHQPSVESAVGMTQGKSTAPRIIRLNQSCSLRSRARALPITTLKKTAAPVKTKAFWKVWRKASLSHSRTKFVMPMKRLGRPMKALEREKYTAITKG